MDGQLSLAKSHKNSGEELFKAIADRIEWNRDIFEEMKKSGLPFATWKMKSSSAGPVEVMTEVPNLGKFNWEKCTKCHGDYIHDGHGRAVTAIEKAKVGPDAQNPPWRLPVCSYSLIHEKNSAHHTLGRFNYRRTSH